MGGFSLRLGGRLKYLLLDGGVGLFWYQFRDDNRVDVSFIFYEAGCVDNGGLCSAVTSEYSSVCFGHGVKEQTVPPRR